MADTGEKKKPTQNFGQKSIDRQEQKEQCWYPQGRRVKKTKLTFTSSCLDNQEAFYRLMLRFNKEAKLLESARSCKKSKAKFHSVVQEQYNTIAGVSEQNLYESGQLSLPKDTFWCHLSTAALET